MLHVNVLPVEPNQPTDKSSENLSFDGQEKGVERFASLVKQEMEQGKRGKADRESSRESGKTSLADNHTDKADASKSLDNQNDLGKHQGKQENNVESTQHKKNTVDGDTSDSDTSENEQSLSNKSTLEKSDVDMENTPDQAAPIHASNKTDVDESQQLLNLLAASDELLNKSQAEADLTKESQETRTSRYLNEKPLSEEALKQLTQDKISATKGEKVLAQVNDVLAKKDNVVDKLKLDSDLTLENDDKDKTERSSGEKLMQSLPAVDIVDKHRSNVGEPLLAKESDILKISSNNAELDKKEQKGLSQLTITEEEKASVNLKNTPLNVELNDVLEQPELKQNHSKSTAQAQELKHSIQLDEQLSSDLATEQLSSDLATEQNAHQGSVSVKTESELTIKHTNTASISLMKSSLTKEMSQQSGQQFSQNEQANKGNEQSSVNTGNEDIALEMSAENEVQVSGTKQDKLQSAVEETLMRTSAHSSIHTSSIGQELERIDEKSNEQLIEQLANRVVKENIQVQKSQLAVETIAIYKKDFANEVKEKVLMMVNQKLQRVDIQLDPPELGNMHVRVNLQNEQAAVSFIVQNQQAKEALEQHIGKLKDMLSESGIDVGDANIEQQAQSEKEHDEQGNSPHDGGEHVAVDHEQLSMHNVNMVKASAVGVDFYA